MNWIPVKWKEPTEEYKKYMVETYGDWFMEADFELPDDGQEVLLTIRYEDKLYVSADVAIGTTPLGFENTAYEEGVIAWCSMPEPYTEVNNENVEENQMHREFDAILSILISYNVDHNVIQDVKAYLERISDSYIRIDRETGYPISDDADIAESAVEEIRQKMSRLR